MIGWPGGVGNSPVAEHYLHWCRLVPFLLRLYKSHLSRNFLTVPHGLLLLLPVMGSSELLGITAPTPHSVWNGNVRGAGGKKSLMCAEPRHVRPWSPTRSASFPGPLMVLIQVTCSSHSDHSSYLSDDQWHHPERHSCFFQKLFCSLP